MGKFLLPKAPKPYVGELVKVVYEVVVPLNPPGYSKYGGEVCLDKMIDPVKNGVEVLEKQGQGYKWLGKKVFKVEKVLLEP